MKSRSLENNIENIIDKMFEIAGHDIRYKDVKGRADNWFQDYTMTSSQNEEWKKWATDYLYKNRIMSKAMSKKQVQWLDLYCGLKIKDNA